jgi:hypothetical protein
MKIFHRDCSLSKHNKFSITKEKLIILIVISLKVKPRDLTVCVDCFYFESINNFYLLYYFVSVRKFARDQSQTEVSNQNFFP